MAENFHKPTQYSGDKFDEFEGGHTVPPPVSDGAVRWWLGAPLPDPDAGGSPSDR